MIHSNKFANTWQYRLSGVLTCLIAAIFYTYEYALRVLPEALSKHLMTAFCLEGDSLGWLASLFFWGYALMQMPCGAIFDRFSAKKIIFINFLISSIATLIFSQTTSYPIALATRFLMGFSGSFAFVGALVLGAVWIKNTKFSLYVGFVQFLGSIGAVLGIIPIVKLSSLLGWRLTIFYIALSGLALSFISLIIIKEPDRKKRTPNLFSKTTKAAFSLKNFFNPYKVVLKQKTLRYTALFAFFIWAPISLFASAWGVNYLEDVRTISRLAASHYIACIWYTIACTSPLLGWLKNYYSNRMMIAQVSSLLGFFSATTLLLFPNMPSSILSLCLVCYGFASSCLVFAFEIVKETQEKAFLGLSTGFINMATISGGMILLPIASKIITLAHHHNRLSTLSPLYYTHQDYFFAFLILPLSFLGAFLTTFFLPKTKHTR